MKFSHSNVDKEKLKLFQVEALNKQKLLFQKDFEIYNESISDTILLDRCLHDFNVFKEAWKTKNADSVFLQFDYKSATKLVGSAEIEQLWASVGEILVNDKSLKRIK